MSLAGRREGSGTRGSQAPGISRPYARPSAAWEGLVTGFHESWGRLFLLAVSLTVTQSRWGQDFSISSGHPKS